eukprot:gene3790-4140_t
MWLNLTLLFLLAIVHPISSLDTKFDGRKWKDEEVISSIHRNVIGCPIHYNVLATNHYTRNNNNNNNSIQSKYTVYIRILHPAKTEKQYLSQLPFTYSQSDKGLASHCQRSNFTDDHWGKSTALRPFIPLNHPGQDRKNCLKLTKMLSTGEIYSFYEGFRSLQRGFYLLHSNEAIIHPSGAVGFQCGVFLGDEGCETRRYLFTKRWMAKYDAKKRNLSYQRYQRVFTIAALWDYNYYHFLAESLTRLVYSLPFLLKHKDVMIHVRAFESDDAQRGHDLTFVKKGEEMRYRIFDLLGIDRWRIISGHVLAHEVFIPRFTRCSFGLSHAYENILLGKHLLMAAYQALRLDAKNLRKALKSPSERQQLYPEKLLIIVQRYNERLGGRYWDNETSADAVKTFSKAFPQHRVQLLTSAVRLPLAQEIYLYSQADVFVGEHGAGMTNMMFMPPNSLIVEFAGVVRDVHAPICGYYGPYAATFGHHHYFHAYNGHTGHIHMSAAATRAAAFYQVIQGKKKVPIRRIVNSTHETHPLFKH